MFKKLLYFLLLLFLCGCGAAGSFFLTAQFRNTSSAESLNQSSLYVESVDENSDLNKLIVDKTEMYVEHTDEQDYNSEPSVQKSAERTKRMILDLTDDEIYLFDCIVECEAGAEPYDGMVGVANVIINRINSSEFPNTLEEVIYDPGQFSPVASGALDSVLATGPSEACVEAVQDALYGKNVVGDYLYFKMDLGNGTAGLSDYMKIGTTIFHDWD